MMLLSRKSSTSLSIVAAALVSLAIYFLVLFLETVVLLGIATLLGLL